MDYKIDCVELKINDYSEQYGKFVFESLEYGQGITLGNLIRRILLSELTGIAIVAIRIAGVNNEFSSIPGVREDILEIILNLKQIILKGNIDKTVLGRLKVQGPLVITANLIQVPEITIVNPNQYIATISDNSIIEIEFKIEKGKNYQLSDLRTLDDPIDFLQIDAIFNPITKIAYEIEQIDIYSKLSKERLILEIWTNGSISPSEALLFSGNIIQKLTQPLINNNFQDIRNELSEKKKKLNEVPIEELVLSARAYNGLKRAQINFIGDLIKYSVKDLKEIKNFGQKSIEEVVSSLKKILDINLI
jgi:DNA-directed RNA polymerase subunit alpha